MAHPVEESLELAAARCDDLAPLVYGRLFAQSPHMEAMFCLDRDGAVRGAMLAHALRAVLDLIGERHFGPSLIHSEAITHANYEVPPGIFASFFTNIRDAVREVAGSAWTPAMEEAWSRLLDETATLVTAR